MSETPEKVRQTARVCLSCGLEAELVENGACPDCGGPSVPLREHAGDLSGRVLGEKYVMLKPLGRGGMGSVYLAKHRVLDKMVAVKVVHLGLADNPRALRRFYDEARNAGRLEHPHNVKVFDFGHEDQGLTYLVMEIVRGQPLYSLGFPISSRRALKMTLQICGALEEAHSLGLVHRDLKPNNVMVTKVDGRDYARVLDYGIAKSYDGSTSLTRSGAIIGTPEYLSPEQASGEDVDRRSDIYSLGVMLYEMVTGKLPFQATSAMGQVYAHIHTEPSPPSEISEIPEEVEALILSCLAKQREERPQSMSALRAHIKTILETDILAADDDPDDTLPARPPELDSRVMASTISDPYTPPPSRTSPGAPVFDERLPEPVRSGLASQVSNLPVDLDGGTVLLDAHPTLLPEGERKPPYLAVGLVLFLLAGALILFRFGVFTSDSDELEVPSDSPVIVVEDGTGDAADPVAMLEPPDEAGPTGSDSVSEALAVLHGAAYRANTEAIRRGRELAAAEDASASEDDRGSRSTGRPRRDRERADDRPRADRERPDEQVPPQIVPVEDEVDDSQNDSESLLERIRRQNERLTDQD